MPKSGRTPLGMWGLSDDVVEAVAFHHYPRPGAMDTLTPLTAVHVANAFDEEDSSAGVVDGHGSILGHEYLAACGMTSRLPLWRAACLSPSIRAM